MIQQPKKAEKPQQAQQVKPSPQQAKPAPPVANKKPVPPV